MPPLNFEPIDDKIAALLRREHKVIERANELLQEFGLGHDGWTFRIGKRKRSLGTCYYDRRVIEYSKFFLDSPWETVEDVLRHEVAHALAGHRAGHGREWKRIAREIGANPASMVAHGAYVNTAKYNFVIRCPDCDREWYRYRMRRRNFGSICPDCKVEVKIYRIKRG